MRSRSLVAAAALLALLVPAPPAGSALGLGLVESPQLGLYFSGSSGRQWTLGTDGLVSGPDAADYLSGAAAGRFTVTDDASPASIVILVDNFSASGGLSIGGATCSYDGGADGACDGTGLVETSVPSAELKVGLDYSSTQAHSGGDAASITMDVSVTYL